MSKKIISHHCAICGDSLSSHGVVLVNGTQEQWCLDCVDACAFRCNGCDSIFPDEEFCEIDDAYYCGECAIKVEEEALSDEN
jgi:hypothetical protein